MTLNELAKEFRKVLRFKWLTLDRTGYITLWMGRPKYIEDWAGTRKTWCRGSDPIQGICGYIFPNAINAMLDLEEYTSERYGIDYSKCIVEVE